MNNYYYDELTKIELLLGYVPSACLFTGKKKRSSLNFVDCIHSCRWRSNLKVQPLKRYQVEVKDWNIYVNNGAYILCI